MRGLASIEETVPAGARALMNARATRRQRRESATAARGDASGERHGSSDVRERHGSRGASFAQQQQRERATAAAMRERHAQEQQGKSDTGIMPAAK